VPTLGNTRQRETNPKSNRVSKLKIAGVIGLLAALIGLGSYTFFLKNKIGKQAGELAEKDVRILTLKSKAEESRLVALPLEKFAEESPATLIRKDEVATITGFVRTQVQEAKCIACIKFQEEFEPTLKRIIKAKNLAEFNEERSIRRKNKWKTIALVGIPVGILVGIIVE